MSTITAKNGIEPFAPDLGEGISELSSRSADGIDVALLWRQRDDTAVIVVVDHRNGEELALDVHESDNALDIFDHPYAYAATRSFGEPAVHVSRGRVKR
jgi:hypothetical protein